MVSLAIRSTVQTSKKVSLRPWIEYQGIKVIQVRASLEPRSVAAHLPFYIAWFRRLLFQKPRKLTALMCAKDCDFLIFFWRIILNSFKKTSCKDSLVCSHLNLIRKILPILEKDDAGSMIFHFFFFHSNLNEQFFSVWLMFLVHCSWSHSRNCLRCNRLLWPVVFLKKRNSIALKIR